jgi:superfamily II RNA helicase
MTLADQLRGLEMPASDALLGRFLDYAAAQRLTLYPAQEEAVLELFEGRNVILNTPTGSGKSLVAAALHFEAVARGRRSVYTCPIKALVNEKWRALCAEFGAENVGLSTGDATVNRGAPILCCTAEILANIALREGARAQVGDVVMDEFHWYADRERGVAWQAPLLALPQARFLLMSATLGDTDFFAAELTRLNGRPTATVRSAVRPVPLEFSYAETPLAQTVERLLAADRAPVYVVHFTQNDAADSAQDFMSLNVATRDQKAALGAALEGFKFSSPYGPDLKKWLRHGIGLHHAGLLPKYRILVEQLAQRGLLRLICGTDTLGVGVNVPIRTVLFTRLSKYGGDKVAVLSARDFHQIAGRAGRKGFDDAGYVVAQAPEHVVENRRLEEKARRDGKRAVKRQPPEGFVAWDERTFARLQAAPPERLTSRFQVTHAMLLGVLDRPDEDGCRALRDLIRRCHDSDRQKAAHLRRAWQLFRALIERRIVEILPPPVPPGAPKLRVNVALPEDFSLNHGLALYLLDTLPLLDAAAPDHALDVITLVESILENPEVVLRRQLDRLRGEKLAELKAAGLDYDERMAELEQLEHPKPRREFIYDTFNAWAARHPWVGQENIRPKSIAREMFAEFLSFADYVRRHELQRAEGLLLRHLHEVYKVLAQTVPDTAKTDAVREMEEYLRTLLRQVDSSLLDEWEKMRDPAWQPRPDAPEARPPGAAAAARDITRDAKTFTAAVRARVFAFLRAGVDGDLADALALTTGSADEAGEPWTEARLAAAFAAHAAARRHLRLDPGARAAPHTLVRPAEDRRTWRVEQILVDPEEQNDWLAAFDVDLAASRAAGEPVLALRAFGPFA